VSTSALRAQLLYLSTGKLVSSRLFSLKNGHKLCDGKLKTT
jgi:hypothetical protein